MDDDELTFPFGGMTKFEGLEELDRRTMVNLVRSIRVLTKTELDITFNYQAEYEQALTLLQREVA